MIIPPVTSASVHSIKFDGVNTVSENAPTQASSVTSTSANNAASIVNFSTLAQLLAATVSFLTQQQKQLQQVPASSPTPNNFKQLVLSTSQFVDAFNNFQTASSTSLASPIDSNFDHALILAIHGKNTQSGTGSTQSFIDSLAKVGIDFHEATGLTDQNHFKIDWTKLESEFNANPTQTSALLSNALQALTVIEETILAAQSTPNLSAKGVNPGSGVSASGSQFNTAQNNPIITTSVATPASSFTSNSEASVVSTVSGNTSLSPNEIVAPVLSALTLASNTAGIENVTTTSNINANSLQQNIQSIPFNPFIAAAVMAYRIGETITTTSEDMGFKPPLKTSEEVSEIHKIDPVKFNPYDGQNGNKRDQLNHHTTTVPGMDSGALTMR